MSTSLIRHVLRVGQTSHVDSFKPTALTGAAAAAGGLPSVYDTPVSQGNEAQTIPARMKLRGHAFVTDLIPPARSLETKKSQSQIKASRSDFLLRCI